MTEDAKKLLKKRRWTGADVGKLLIESFINDVLHSREPDFKPIVSQERFRELESKLSEWDAESYSTLGEINTALLTAYNYCLGDIQKYENGFFRLSTALELCESVESALNLSLSYPLIVTQEKYNDTKRTAAELLVKSEEHYLDLFFYTLRYSLAMDTTPELQAAIDDLKAEPVTNPRILRNYNRITERGYITLRDGTRSDETPREQWRSAIIEQLREMHPDAPEDLRELLHQIRDKAIQEARRFRYEGITAIKEAYKEDIGEDLPITAPELIERLYKHLERYDQRAAIIDDAPLYVDMPIPEPFPEVDTWLFMRAGGIPGFCTWHYYDAPPELNKAELLTAYSVYSILYCETPEQLREFKDDYPKIAQIIDARISAAVPEIGDDQTAGQPVTWGRLADLDFLNFRDLIEPDTQTIVDAVCLDPVDVTGQTESRRTARLKLYEKRTRAQTRGIAILQGRTLNAPTGFYDNSIFISELAKSHSLEQLRESEERVAELRRLRSSLVIPALRNIIGFNTLLELLADVYGIPDLLLIRFDCKKYIEQLREYNNRIYTLYSTVYGDGTERREKQGVINSAFIPFKLAELQPADQAVEQIREKLQTARYSAAVRSYLRYFDTPIKELYEGGAE